MHLGVAEPGHAQKIVNIFGPQFFLVFLAALDHAARHLAADVADLALQVAHPGLARVVADDLQNRVIAEDYVLIAQAGLFALLFHQVLLRDFQLLLLRIALQAQNLHAVLQRGRNGVQHVGGGHKQHLRQVVIHVKVMILEGGVLLRVQHLQQRRGRVAAEVRCHLVYFVQQEDRVLGAGPLHVLDNLAGHGADVGAPMAANLGLVVDAAEREPHKFAASRFGDRHSQRSFAHARRPCETKDRALGIFHELTHGEKLKNALLDLFQAVVVCVQHLFRVLDGAGLFRALLPRHRQQPVDVVAAHGGFGRHGRHGFEFFEFLNSLVQNLFGHARGFNLLA